MPLRRVSRLGVSVVLILATLIGGNTLAANAPSIVVGNDLGGRVVRGTVVRTLATTGGVTADLEVRNLLGVWLNLATSVVGKGKPQILSQDWTLLKVIPPRGTAALQVMFRQPGDAIFVLGDWSAEHGRAAATLTALQLGLTAAGAYPGETALAQSVTTLMTVKGVALATAELSTPPITPAKISRAGKHLAGAFADQASRAIIARVLAQYGIALTSKQIAVLASGPRWYSVLSTIAEEVKASFRPAGSVDFRWPLPREASRRVLALIWSPQSTGSALWKVSPTAVYEGGKYRNPHLYAQSEDEARRLFQRSVLADAKTFAAYHRGKLVGSLTVEKLELSPGCGEGGSIQGVGQLVPPRVPAGFIYGLNPPLSDHSGFYLTQQPSTAQRALVIRHAKELLRAANVPNWGSYRKERLVPTGQVVITSSELLDLNQDGNPEVLVSLDATLKPLREITYQPERARLKILLVVENVGLRPRVLLSLIRFYHPHDDQYEYYEFKAAIDMSGDGIAELLLEKHVYEGSVYELFARSGDTYRLILIGFGEGC